MTKTKLAKLKAQAHVGNNLAELAFNNQMRVPTFQQAHEDTITTLQQSDEITGHMAIDADSHRDAQIREELLAYNSNTVAYGAGHTDTSLGLGLQTVNNSSTYGVPDVEIPYDFTFADFIDYPGPNATTPAPLADASTAEVERQIQIWDDAVADLFPNNGE